MTMFKRLAIFAFLFLFVVSLCSCISDSYYCAAFDSAEEVRSFLNTSFKKHLGDWDTSIWSYFELPADERFVDADYFIYDEIHGTGFIMKNTLIAYKVNIDGEYVTIIASTDKHVKEFCSFNKHVHLEVCDAGYISIAVKDNLRYFTTNPSTVFDVVYWKNHKPVGMIADLVSFESEETAAEYFRSLKSVRVFDWKGNAQSGIDWFFVDERDVPQEEKDALALELAGVLFDHYVEAGFIQLYDK